MLFQTEMGDWQGGVRFDTAANSGYLPTQSSYSWPFTTVEGTNRYLLIALSIYTAGVSGLAVNYNAIPLSFIKGQSSSTTRTEVWGMIAPPIGTFTVDVSLSDVANSSALASAWFQVDQSNPVDATGSSQGTGTAASATLNTVSPNDQSFSALATAGLFASVNSPQYQLNAVSGATGTGGISRQMASVAATYPISWTIATPSNWSLVTIALRPVTFLTPPSLILNSGGGSDAASMLVGYVDWW